MGSIGRYIFRATSGAFVLVLISVTALIWITQALRSIDLITAQDQSIFVFIGLTTLTIPMLVLVIAPIALMIAVAHTLNKLGNDSELIVMNAAGMPPWRVFRPFLAFGLCVSALVAFLAVYGAPKALRELRVWSNAVRTDIVTSSLQPGRFLVLDNNLTLHIRERRPNGQLVGIMVDDQRDNAERSTVIAEQGDVLVNERGTYLVLEKGAVHRQELGNRDPTIVRFEKHAFDLSRLGNGSEGVRFSAQERYLPELIAPDPSERISDNDRNAYRAELHNRLLAPLYPLAFLMLTFAYLGAPRTTRQGRALSMVSAVVLVLLLRVVGFVGGVYSVSSPAAAAVPYLALLAAAFFSYRSIGRGVVVEPPAFIVSTIDTVVQGFQRRTASATGATS